MLAPPVARPRPLSLLPLMFATPFLLFLGGLAWTGAETEPVWPAAAEAAETRPAACVMMLSDLGPSPADEAASGCTAAH